MFKRIVDRTPVIVLGTECEVITYQIRRKHPLFLTTVQPSFPILRFFATGATLGVAKRNHWQCVDVICEFMGCINIDDNEICT